MDGRYDVPAQSAHPHGAVNEADNGDMCGLGINMTKDIVTRRIDNVELRRKLLAAAAASCKVQSLTQEGRWI